MTDAVSPAEIALSVWAAMGHEERLEMLPRFAPPEWYSDMLLPVLLRARGQDGPLTWGYLKAEFKARGGNPFDLEKAVDAEIERRRSEALAISPAVAAANGVASALPPRRALGEQPPCPALPASGKCSADYSGAAPWLDAYAAHSQRWSPRGIHGAHQAVGLWLLSTIAARRCYAQVGSRTIVPALSIVLAARSTLYAKSTTAQIGRDVLRRAGLERLLAADDSTPQALLHAMAGSVPRAYGRASPEEQEQIAQRLAFAGQRGAYLEEWGGMLSQMSRKDSPMADFHKVLRQIDDGTLSYSKDTVIRGQEDIQMPYLAVLASATPHDLAPFMAEGAAWWHDGFWPRMAFIAPEPREAPSLAQSPRRGYQVPATLIVPLADWHKRLGVPSVEIVEIMDAKEKPTGEYQALLGALPQTEIGIAEEVYEGYEAYNAALIEMLHSGDTPPDFDASYGRLHTKALRIALLLASLGGHDEIRIEHWAYGQAVAEQWRANLHNLYSQIAQDIPLSKEEKQEQAIIRYLARAGQATAREIQQFCNLRESASLKRTLAALEATGQLVSEQHGRTVRYGLLPQEGPEENSENSTLHAYRDISKINGVDNDTYTGISDYTF